MQFVNSAVIVNSIKKLSIESTSSNKSSFSHSPIFLKGKSLFINNANFDNSDISCYNIDGSGGSVTIKNCYFSPPDGQSNNPYNIIYLSRYSDYDILNNNISFNSGVGINLYNCGIEGTTHRIRDNIINFTASTSYNDDNGIKIYQSYANIENNQITNAKYGLSIYNNSVVNLIGNSGATNQSETQQIINNTEYQVFVADYPSFPISVQYNYFDNNSTLPLIYCSGTNIPPGSLNVSCNYWGNNFSPTQDLFPYFAYDYTPIWNFTGPCSGKQSYEVGFGQNNLDNNNSTHYQGSVYDCRVVKSTDSVYDLIDNANNLMTLRWDESHINSTEKRQLATINQEITSFLGWKDALLNQLYPVHDDNLWGEMEKSTTNSCLIYPNPTEEILTLLLRSRIKSITHIKIYDLSGKKVLDQQVLYNGNDKPIIIDVSTLQNGLYNLAIYSGAIILENKHIIINK